MTKRMWLLFAAAMAAASALLVRKAVKREEPPPFFPCERCAVLLYHGAGVEMLRHLERGHFLPEQRALAETNRFYKRIEGLLPKVGRA